MLRWKSISVSKKGRPSQYEALTKIGIPIIRIRLSHSHGIFILKIPVYGKTVFILKGPLFQFDDVEHPWIKVKLPRSKTRIIHTWWRHQMKKFPRYWPFVWGIHRSTVNFPHKGQWGGVLMFSLICAWTNGWANNPYAGDLSRHRAHYDVIVMDLTCVAMADVAALLSGTTDTLSTWLWRPGSAALQKEIDFLEGIITSVGRFSRDLSNQTNT